jgi:hypothetical protein
MDFLKHKTTETIAGVGTFSWIFIFIAAILAQLSQSTMLNLVVGVFQIYFLFSWVYMMADALGVIRRGKADIKWFVAIFLVGPITAPLYWLKVMRPSRIWAERASQE